MQKRVTQLIGSIANEAIISELYFFFEYGRGDYEVVVFLLFCLQWIKKM